MGGLILTVTARRGSYKAVHVWNPANPFPRSRQLKTNHTGREPLSFHREVRCGRKAQYSFISDILAKLLVCYGLCLPHGKR